MDGIFECLTYTDGAGAEKLWKCDVAWGTFSGPDYKTALQGAVNSAQEVMGGGEGKWTPLIKFR